jgi:hypothetical protein
LQGLVVEHLAVILRQGFLGVLVLLENNSCGAFEAAKCVQIELASL